jgi:hypothetical protein
MFGKYGEKAEDSTAAIAYVVGKFSTNNLPERHRLLTIAFLKVTFSKFVVSMRERK